MRIRLPGLTGIAMLISIASCTVQKRVYMAGYHIEWKAFSKTSPRSIRPDIMGYSLNAYNALSTKPSQETIINAEDPDEIYCTEGTVIGFPENAFVYEDGGGSIKCTQVAVYVTEFYTMSDIIASGLTTTDNKRTLASAGMVHIEARCHGEKLKLKPGKKLTLKMPAFPGDNTMKAFSGKLKDGIVDWKVDGKLKIDYFNDAAPDGGSGDVAPYADSRSNPEGVFRPGSEGEYQETYIMSMTKLGWINCDRFYETRNPMHFIVKADSVEKTFVALIFRDIKSVLPGYQFADFSTEFAGIPKGADVTILAYRVDTKTKQVVVGREDITVGDTGVVQLAMQAVNLDDFKTMLKEFD